MSFGRNPYVPKAEAAEQKADAAGDDGSRERAYREAAHEWDRAASREKPGKRRDEYLGNAERNRSLADDGGEAADDETETGAASEDTAPEGSAPPKGLRLVKP